MGRGLFGRLIEDPTAGEPRHLFEVGPGTEAGPAIWPRRTGKDKCFYLIVVIDHVYHVAQLGPHLYVQCI